MGAPYSLDLRERVVAAVAGGMTRAEAARRFEVSHSSVIRRTQQAAETGSPAACRWAARSRSRWPMRRRGYAPARRETPTSRVANCWRS